MPRIFMSFRKTDDRWMRERVFQALVGAFGADEVFKSGVSIPVGAGYAEILRRQAAECDLMLVLIGAHWLDVADEDGQPLLHRDEDWVRVEVATAFQAGNRVVPVLLGDSTMLPSADALPEDIATLAGLQFLRVAETHVQEGLDNMVAGIRQLFPNLPQAVTPEPESPGRPADPLASSTTTASGTHSTAVTGGSGNTSVATGKHAVAVNAGAGSHISIVQRARTWAVANPVLAVALVVALVLGGGSAVTYALVGSGSPSSSSTGGRSENTDGIPPDPGVGSVENATAFPSTDPPTDPSTSVSDSASDSVSMSPEDSSSSSSPAAGQGTIAVVDDGTYLTSGHAIAKLGSSSDNVTFIDPTTGTDVHGFTLRSPSDAASSSVDSRSDVALLDNGADTLVIFVYTAHYAEHDLTAARDDERYQVWSQATGNLTMDALLPFGASHPSIVGVDPSGWVVLDTYSGVIGVPVVPHAGSAWQFAGQSTTDTLSPWVVHEGRVLIVDSPILGQATTLNVLDVSNGHRIVPAMDEPGGINAGSKASTNLNYFEVGGDVLATASAAVVKTAHPCFVLDPRQPLCLAYTFGSTGADGYAVIGLASGSTLAKVTWPDDSTSEVSFFDGKLYLRTSTQRLIVDAHTGAVVSNDWTLAPQEVHDGWYIATSSDGTTNVYPGSP